MKKILVLMLLVTAFAAAQDSSKIIIEENGNKMIVGACGREAFSDSAFAWWWNSEYDMYEPEEEALQNIKENLDGVTITIVLGTWCSDSRREVPRFMKILDLAGFPAENVKFIAVDREKKAENTGVEEMEINFVPTFIIYKNGTESGRIIETPQESLERDLEKIIE